MSGKVVVNYKLFKKRTPLAVCWLITNRCNFKCAYCKMWKYKQKEVSTEQALSLIDQLSDMKTQRLTISGGEPLLRGDIGKIIKYAKDKGLSTGVCTNGFLIPEKIKYLKMLDMVHISFDGPKEVHDKQIQKNTYEKVLNGIKIAKKEGIKVWLTCVITKYNVNKLKDIISIVKKLRVPIYFRIVMTRPLSSSNKKINPNILDYRNAIKYLISEKKRRGPIINSLFNLKQMLKWPHGDKLKCYSKHLRALIDCEGNVYPCDTFIGNKNALNYTKVGFKKAFKNFSNMKCSDDMSTCNSWDYPTMELNNICNFNIDSIINMFNSLK